MSRKAQEIEKTVTLLAERGYTSDDLMWRYSPEQVMSACNAWAKRVGVYARDSAAVAIVTGSRYPGLFERLLPLS
jgi:hypothetical protein